DRYLHPGKLPPNIELHSQTDEVERFYSRADVLLNLSRVDQWVETFGLTIVEGMAFGLPVIVPPVGGPAEIVSHSVEGWLVDSRDSGALDRALLTLIDHPSRARSMSKAARRRALEFTWENFASKLETQRALVAGDVNYTKAI